MSTPSSDPYADTLADPLAELARLEGVPRAVAVATAAVDAVLADRGHRRVAGESAAEALLAGARASAELSDDPAGRLAGTVRLATDLPRLAGDVRTAPGQVLARLHTLLAYGQVAEADLGRLRGDPGVAARMADLGRLLAGRTAAPGLVLAAVVHAEVATVAPFGGGDDIIARAMEHLVLMSTGLDPYGLIVVEAGHGARRADYAAGLAGYVGGTLDGVRSWLLHVCEAVVAGAEASPLNAGRRRT